jgi:hypothetical protein
MAKSTKKIKKLTTNQAIEQLLGRKAAKRLRLIAMDFAKDAPAQEKKTASKKR